MTQVYIVKCCSGYFDDYSCNIAGAFDNEQDADNLVDTLNKKATKIQEKTPVINNDDGDGDEYWDYYVKNEYWLDGFKTWIETIETNKILINI